MFCHILTAVEGGIEVRLVVIVWIVIDPFEPVIILKVALLINIEDTEILIEVQSLLSRIVLKIILNRFFDFISDVIWLPYKNHGEDNNGGEAHS